MLVFAQLVTNKQYLEKLSSLQNITELQVKWISDFTLGDMRFHIVLDPLPRHSPVLHHVGNHLFLFVSGSTIKGSGERPTILFLKFPLWRYDNWLSNPL